MRLRPYRNEDFFYIREWIEDDRTHAMWSVGKLPFPFTEAELTALLREEEKSMDQSMFTAVLEDGTPAGSFCIRFCPQDNSAYQEEKWGRYVLCLEKSEFLKA